MNNIERIDYQDFENEIELDFEEGSDYTFMVHLAWLVIGFLVVFLIGVGVGVWVS